MMVSRRDCQLSFGEHGPSEATASVSDTGQGHREVRVWEKEVVGEEI